MKITVLVEIYSGIPEVSYIGDDEGAKALWMDWMKDLENQYADRKDIRNEDGSVSCDMNGEINTRTSWDHGYFCFHKTEWRVDSMDMDSEAFARMAAQAFARMAEEA